MHDLALGDKCSQIDELNQRLSEAQRRVTQLLTAQNGGGGIAGEQARRTLLCQMSNILNSN